MAISRPSVFRRHGEAFSALNAKLRVSTLEPMVPVSTRLIARNTRSHKCQAPFGYARHGHAKYQVFGRCEFLQGHGSCIVSGVASFQTKSHGKIAREDVIENGLSPFGQWRDETPPGRKAWRASSSSISPALGRCSMTSNSVIRP